MQTITQIHYDRLIAEAEEADLVGEVKIAENITRQIEKTAVRSENAPYVYTNESFTQDVQENLWSAIIRTADFHGVTIDAQKAQSIVEFYSEELLKSVRAAAKISTVVGSYEPPVPGEDGEVSVIDLSED